MTDSSMGLHFYWET